MPAAPEGGLAAEAASEGEVRTLTFEPCKAAAATIPPCSPSPFSLLLLPPLALLLRCSLGRSLLPRSASERLAGKSAGRAAGPAAEGVGDGRKLGRVTRSSTVTYVPAALTWSDSGSSWAPPDEASSATAGSAWGGECEKVNVESDIGL